jgi:uncharacterized protein YjdB
MKTLDKMRFILLPLTLLLAVMIAVLAAPAISMAATTVPLGTAANFAVLAGSGITNTGTTTIAGSVGSSPTPTESGFNGANTVTVTGGTNYPSSDNATSTAQTDLAAAYNNAAAQTPAATIPVELGSTTLSPGIYNSTAGTFGITGPLTLNGAGVYIFQMGSTLTTAAGSSVLLTNGAEASNVFWQVGSSATLGANSTLSGTILALTSITTGSGATVTGRLLAENAAVTLDSTTISVPVALLVGGATTTMVNGATMQMSAAVLPANAANKTVTWSETGPATIDANGLLTATGVGTVIVTATANDGSGVTGTETITVTPIQVTGNTVTGAGGAISVVNGETLRMSATVLPSNAATQAVTWSVTAGTGTATIDPASGLLTAVTPGTVIVTATANDGSGIVGTETITVTPILVTSITVTGTATGS